MIQAEPEAVVRPYKRLREKTTVGEKRFREDDHEDREHGTDDLGDTNMLMLTLAVEAKAGDIEISAENEEALKNKIAEFKDKHPSRKAPTLGALKKVFRRGAGAFSTSFRPTITGGKPNSRNAWAMARVNKFLKMAGGGEVKESYRKADGDLL